MGRRSRRVCSYCGAEMDVVGYIQLINGYRTKKIPAKWKCRECGLVIDAM